MKLLKVYLHCLFKILSKKEHHMCSTRVGWKFPDFYCSCGYKNNNITWEQMKVLNNIIKNEEVKIRNYNEPRTA